MDVGVPGKKGATFPFHLGKAQAGGLPGLSNESVRLSGSRESGTAEEEEEGGSGSRNDHALL